MQGVDVNFLVLWLLHTGHIERNKKKNLTESPGQLVALFCFI